PGRQSITEFPSRRPQTALTAGLALLVHFVALIRRQGREAQLVGKSENLQTLIGLYNLPADLIS
ncbi:hypothetical protein ACSLOS_30370, partial [Klebsiella pneumoniae]